MAPKKDYSKDGQAKPKMVSTKSIFDKLGIGSEDAQKYMRDFLLEMEKMKDDIELEETLKKPTLTPEEIWAIKPTTFYAWRIKHDLPRILAYFNERLARFKEWKEEFDITDEMLMRHGISNYIALKDIKDRDKHKYIFYKNDGNPAQDFLQYVDLSNKVSVKWGEPESFVLKTKFVGYLDWCEENKIIAFPGRTNQNLFEFTSASNIRSNDIKVYILDKFELLKVGGITVQGNAASLINPKYFEFVNGSFLTFRGLINSAGIVLQFVNSIVDDLRCDDLEYALVDFNSSSVKNLNVSNSVISQWSFYKTIVTGKISNSRLNMIRIVGGGFHAILDNTFISDVFAQHTNELSFISTYQTLKKTYADQGDDRNAIFYFLKEKGIERQALYNAIFNQRVYSSFKITWFKKSWLIFKASFFAILLYLSSLLNNFYWGYGRKPFRIIGCSFVIITICAIFYLFNQNLMNKPGHQLSMNFADSFYFSAVTFTTLGYGDFTPNGFLRIVTAFEAIFGGMSIGFLVAGFSNLKY